MLVLPLRMFHCDRLSVHALALLQPQSFPLLEKLDLLMDVPKDQIDAKHQHLNAFWPTLANFSQLRSLSMRTGNTVPLPSDLAPILMPKLDTLVLLGPEAAFMPCLPI